MTRTCLVLPRSYLHNRKNCLVPSQDWVHMPNHMHPFVSSLFSPSGTFFRVSFLLLPLTFHLTLFFLNHYFPRKKNPFICTIIQRRVYLLQQNILSEIFPYSGSVTWTAGGKEKSSRLHSYNTTQLTWNRLNQPGAILPFTKHIMTANENIQMGPLSCASNDQLEIRSLEPFMRPIKSRACQPWNNKLHSTSEKTKFIQFSC